MPHRTPPEDHPVDRQDNLGELLRDFLTVLGADVDAIGEQVRRSPHEPLVAAGPQSSRVSSSTQPAGAVRCCTGGRSGRWR